jgi:ribonuclease D
MTPVPQGAQPAHAAHAAIDVNTAEAAQEAARRIGQAAEIAVDLEADAMHAFRPRLCFVQVATDQEIFLLDTLAPGVEAKQLEATFADPSKTKFFHAAGGDLQYLADTGIRVKGLFDTHRAATLLGWPKVGLADLVLERLNVPLAKEHQQSDFSIRPLPAEMREYIANDVRYLCEIGRQVRAECTKRDILEEVELDCQRMADEALARPEIGSDYRPKVPRGKLSANQYALAMAVVHELHRLRLQWAEAANVPLGRMLSNAAVTAIALRMPSTLQELKRTENVRGPLVREHGETILSMLRSMIERSRKGELAPEEANKGERDPKRKKREELLKEFRGEKALERKVTPSVVLPNLLIDDLAKAAPSSIDELARVPYCGEKRARLYGAELVELLRKA